MLDDEKVLVEDEVIETTEEVVEDDKPEATAVPEELTVTIGETEPEAATEQAAPEWVKELRKTHRETQKRNRELEEELKTFKQKTLPALGKKPSLEDYDYDAEQYETALFAWTDKKREHDAAAQKAVEERERQNKDWQDRLAEYQNKKVELKLSDYEDAEETAKGIFDVTQQGIVLQGASNPALVVYALGKNPTKAKELAAIKDPIKFAFEVAKLEGQLKMTPKKKAPAPEKMVEGGSAPSSSSNQTLERLRADAEKTGDYSKVREYKRKIKK